MILTTTSTVEGRPALAYMGIVTGEVIVGANIFRDLFSTVRDIVGGRARSYEHVLKEGRLQALAELEAEAQKLGADAVLGIDLDYEVVGSRGAMLMITATGTAVRLG